MNLKSLFKDLPEICSAEVSEIIHEENGTPINGANIEIAHLDKIYHGINN